MGAISPTCLFDASELFLYQMCFHCQWLIVFQTNFNDQAYCMVSEFVAVWAFSLQTCIFDCMHNSASLIDQEKAVWEQLFPPAFFFFYACGLFFEYVHVFLVSCVCVSAPQMSVCVCDREWVCVVERVLAEAWLSHWKMYSEHPRHVEE